jgi:hypothetical protein
LIAYNAWGRGHSLQIRRCHLNRLAIFSYVAGWVPSVWDKSLLNSFPFAYGKHWWHATAARLLTNRLITAIRWA